MSTKVHLHSLLWFCFPFLLFVFKGASVLLFKLGLQVNTSTPYLLFLLYPYSFHAYVCMVLCFYAHLRMLFRPLELHSPSLFLICKGGNVVIEAKKPLLKLFQAWALGVNFHPLFLFVYVCTILCFYACLHILFGPSKFFFHVCTWVGM